MEAPDRCFLDGTVHPFNLTVGPGMIGLCQPMFDPIRLADHVKAHWPGVDGIAVARLLCKLNTIVGQDRMDLVGHSFQKVL